MNPDERTPLFPEFPPVDTAAWEAKILEDLKGGDYEKKLIWKTGEGFDVRPYYRAEDLSGLESIACLPGEAPNVRGNHPGGNPWLIRQDIAASNIPEANKQARTAVACGADALGLRSNEVTTHRELSELLEGIDLAKTQVNFISAKSYPLTLEFLIYELKQKAIDGAAIKGSINFDPISYLLLHGDYYIGRENDLEEAEYLLNIAREHLPSFRVITLNGHYFQDSGSTLVQELAFTLASACEYLARLTDRGLSPDDVAPRMMLSMATGPNYFLEIAKIRAARMLWSRLMDHFGAKDEGSHRVHIHASTALWNKSVYDPYVNMLRTTTESMAAALGTADSVTTLPFDISYKNPDEFSSRIARNQQLVLKEESYLDKIADPAGGSYYIETLTESIAKHAWDLFLDVEQKGGMLACIKSGFIQEQIEKSRAGKEADIAQRKITVLGTNQFPNLTETMAGAVTSSATVVEEPVTPVKRLKPFRIAGPFEALRLATDKHVAAGNKRPSVFLFTIGNLAMLRARAGFASNFFGCAGYEIIDNAGFPTAEAGIEAALASSAPIVVICSSDEEYPAIVPAIAGGLKSASPSVRVIVAGYPKEHIEAFRSAGVDGFIHVRSNLLETLSEFQQSLSIPF